MNITKNLKRHEVTAYLILTFLFTWAFWIISYAWQNQTLDGLFRILGAFMPSVMSVIITGCFYGRIGIKELLKKLTIWKVNPLLYAFALFYTGASIFLPSYICTIIGLDYKTGFGNQLSGFQLTTPLSVIACFFAVVFFGGPIGEELGWRGFLLPKLQKDLTR